MAVATLCRLYVVVVVAAWACSGTEMELVPRSLSNRKTGDSFAIQCRLMSPTDEVIVHPKWYHATSAGADEPISHTGRVRTKQISPTHTNLLFSKAERSDDGTYKCIAQVGEETLVKSIDLKLYEGIHFYDTPTIQHPNDGEDAQIVCRVRADPEPSILWFRNDELITAGDERGYQLRNDSSVLFIPNFDVHSDNGIYRCQAIQQDTGDFQSLDITVDAYIKPIIEEISPELEVNENEDAVLTCKGSGNPEPEMSWIKNGLTISNDSKYLVEANGKLVISSAISDDVGSYTCRAINVLSVAEKSTHLSVILKPKVEHIQDMQVRKGDSMQVTCRYEGNEPVRAFWRFGGQIYEPIADDDHTTPHDQRHTVSKSDNELSLRISFVELEDAGLYECVTENRAGSDMGSFKLRVTYPAMITDKSSEAVRAVNGQQVIVFCEAVAEPEPSWTWLTPEGREIETDNTKYSIETSHDGLNSTLKVIVSEAEDYGKYACRAFNGVGSAAVRLIDVFEVHRPPRPELIFENQHPNYAALLIPNYAGLPMGDQPLEVIFEVAKEADFMSDDFTWEDGDVEQVASRYDPSGSYIVRSLRPTTKYVFRVHSKNEAGISDYAEAPYETDQPRVPETPVVRPLSDGNQCSPFNCMVAWDEPNNGGSDILSYDVEYQSVGSAHSAESLPIDETKWTSVGPIPASEQFVLLQYLLPSTAYMLRVRARNDEGDSNWGQAFFETTAETWSTAASIGAGGIVAIVFFVLLIIFVVVDVSCYYINHCGVLMWVCINCCGKTAPQMKAKEIAMEEGQASLDEKKPLKDALQEMNEESSKLISAGRDYPEKKNTVV